MRIVIQADGRKIASNTAGQPLTSGSRGVEAQFDLSADYAGLAVTAAFVAGDAKVDVALTASSRCVVPWEVLETAGNMLLIGVVGKDGAGNTVIPTLWCKVGLIECGTVVSGIEPGDPTPDIAAQLLQIAQEVYAEAQDAKDSAVSAQQAIEGMTVEAHDDPLGPSVEKRVDPETGAVTLDFGIQRPPVQSVNNKTGAVTLNLDEIPDGVQYARATAAQVYQIGTNAKSIADIKAKIPSQASAQNPLTDKAYVDNAIQTNSAHYRGNWPTWADVPTDDAAYPADDSGSTTPASNDYMAVQDAAGYPVDSGDQPLKGTWRFKYAGLWAVNGKNGWKPEYQVSDSPLTAAQLAALNSGATAENIASIAEKYVKPVDGIPLVDLSQDVAESLGKANTAYQLPANGIPKTDLAASVQQSLDKADTALQEHQSLAAYRTAAAQDAIDAAQDEKINTNADDIDAIEAKIPPQASATNQLADKDFVNSSINSSTAFFRGSFASHAALFAVPWQTTNPAAANFVTNNDYAYVADDETHNDEAWRYIYVLQPGGTGNGWQPQFKVNDSPLTAAQLAALNSGATAENIASIADKYVKPANGIPKADLAAGVQQSLDKADTALQEHQSLAAYRTAADQDTIDAAQDEKIAAAAQATEETTVGPAAIATFNASAANMPLKSLLVNIEPVQDLHGYDHPWPGGGGKNLAEPGHAWNINASGVIEGTPLYESVIVKVNEGQTYCLSVNGTKYAGIPVLAFYRNYPSIGSASYDNSRSVDTPNPFISPIDGYAVIRLTADETKIQVEAGSAATAYEPYSNICPISGWTGCNIFLSPSTDAQDGNTYPITFPTEAGTVYGGTLDVTNGVLTVDRAAITYDGTFGDWSVAPGTRRAWIVNDSVLPVASNDKVSSIICNKLKTISLLAGIDGQDGIAVTTGKGINFFISGITDDPNITAESFKSYLGSNPMQVVVPLATPITYHLTPQEVTTLLGTNNVWADTGDVTVTYGAYLETIKTHADRLGDSMLSAIAPLETTYTASRAYAVGAFLFVGTTFYKVTQTIAEGGTITPGTNAVQTTVAEQLIALAAG